MLAHNDKNQQLPDYPIEDNLKKNLRICCVSLPMKGINQHRNSPYWLVSSKTLSRLRKTVRMEFEDVLAHQPDKRTSDKYDEEKVFILSYRLNQYLTCQFECDLAEVDKISSVSLDRC